VNTQFDELTKSMARSVTRRAALNKFGLGLAGMALAALSLSNNARAAGGTCLPSNSPCSPSPLVGKKCCSGRCLDRGMFRFTCA